MSITGFKSDVDELDIDKLKIVPIDLKTFTNALEKYAAKKILYNELMIKFNTIDSDKQTLEKKALIKGYVILVNLSWPKTLIEASNKKLQLKIK